MPTAMRACFCVGPQNGAPACPCRMACMTPPSTNIEPLIEPWPTVEPWTPETPEEKAKRIGVPVIPKRKAAPPFPAPNGPRAVCGECGITIHDVMMYSCPCSNCPCGLGPSYTL